jgi:hypothetical protein
MTGFSNCGENAGFTDLFAVRLGPLMKGRHWKSEIDKK